MSYDYGKEDFDPSYMVYLQHLQVGGNEQSLEKRNKSRSSFVYPKCEVANQNRDSRTRRSSFHISTTRSGHHSDLGRSKQRRNTNQECGGNYSYSHRKKSKIWSTPVLNHSDHRANLVEANVDADYAMFLKQLMNDGRIDVSGMSNKTGRSPNLLKSGKDHHHKVLRSCTDLYCNRNVRKTCNFTLEEEKKGGPELKMTANCYSCRKHHLVNFSASNRSLRTYCIDSGLDADYVVFLKHLKEDGTSYVYATSDGTDGSQAYLKFNGENQQKVLGSYRNTSSSQTVLKGCNSDKTKETSARPGSRSTDSFSYQQRHHEAELSFPDQSYQKFLNHAILCGPSMILELGCGVTVKYGAGDEPQAVPETTATKIDSSSCKGSKSYEKPFSNRSTRVHEHEQNLKSLHLQRSSYFENNLREVMAKPFDQKEYEELFKAAKMHKPLQNTRHLRYIEKSWNTNIPGLSYLDSFPELAKQIDAADCKNRLTLLRGFFFWLENLCHEGAFQPWSQQRSSNAGAFHIVLED